MHTKKNNTKNFVIYIIIILLIWSISVTASLIWNIHKTNDQAYKSAELSAINSLNRDQAMRFWFAKHGGLYIRQSETLEPIQFINHLQNRDIADLDRGEIYTLHDPATILRKMMEEFPDLYKTTVRMISLYPLNEKNKPDKHEQEVLEQMKKGLSFSNLIKQINGKDTLQVMYPLWGNANCLVCHNRYFKSEDLIGAGGVEIDMAPFLASANQIIQNLVISHSLIWVLGFIGVVVFYRQVKFWINSHLLLQDKLLDSQANLELRVEHRTNELNKLSVAVEGSPAIIIITDDKNKIEYVNPIFTKVSGYTKDEIIGKTPVVYKSGLNDPEIYQHMWDALKNNGSWHGEFRNKRKDGSLYWVSSAISPILSATGKIQNYIAIQEDITEKKRTEQELIKAKEIAETSNKAKSEFISSISHELRTPLNAIIGFAELFEYDNSLELKHKNNAKKIFNAGNYLLKLINDILDLSKIESSQLDINREVFLFTSLIDESLKLINPIAENKNITIVINNPDCECTIYADFIRTKQVVLNLLSNAVKYSKDNSQILIDCQNMEYGNIRVTIKDYGIGIDKEKQKQLFEPFNRLGAEQSNVEGTGVGLYISKQLIEAMDGLIGLESEKLQGSSFWIELPAKNKTKIKTKELTGSGITDKNILYLDTDRSNIQLMAQIIEKKDNLTLIQVKTLEQLLIIIEEKQLSLVVVDSDNMDINSIQNVLQAQKQQDFKEIPILVIGSSDTFTFKQNGINYINKPIDVIKTLEKISILLNET